MPGRIFFGPLVVVHPGPAPAGSPPGSGRRCPVSRLFIAEPECPQAERSNPKEKYRYKHDRRIPPPVAYPEYGVEREALYGAGDAGAGEEFWDEARARGCGDGNEPEVTGMILVPEFG
ncbi:MAG: hypothetical protein WC626_09825 [Methanoregula sp.]